MGIGKCHLKCQYIRWGWGVEFDDVFAREWEVSEAMIEFWNEVMCDERLLIVLAFITSDYDDWRTDGWYANDLLPKLREVWPTKPRSGIGF